MVLDLIGRVLTRVADALLEIRERTGNERQERSAAQLQKLLRGETIQIEDPATGETVVVEAESSVEDLQEGLSNILGELPEEAQEAILEEIEPGEIPRDEAVRDAIQGAEGAAVGEAIAVLGASLGLEAASAGQLESQQFIVSQLLTFAALEDVLGVELQATVEEGVLPPLQREINREYREKTVDLQDFVEQQVRNKDRDNQYLDGLDRYGIREGDVPILEEVALEAIEFEELIETPAELGLVVDDEILDEVLDINGYPEDLKDFLRQVNDEIPRSNRVWEERTTTEELVSQLDTLVEDGELDPAEAVAILPDEVDVAKEALGDRFELYGDVPAGAPTRALVEKSFHQGYTDLASLQNRIERLEYNTDRYDDVLRTVVRDEIDGDLQEAFALGFLTEAQYGEYLDFVGLDQETQAALFAGQDLSDVADSRLQEAAAPADRPVSALPGIGQSRATALETIGVETLADLAAAEAQAVADAAQISPETAQELIDLAGQASS